MEFAIVLVILGAALEIAPLIVAITMANRLLARFNTPNLSDEETALLVIKSNRLVKYERKLGYLCFSLGALSILVGIILFVYNLWSY